MPEADAAVIGGGSWGTALAILLARNGRRVLLAARDPEEIRSLRELGENARYLPGVPIPPEVVPVSLAMLPPAAFLVLAVPAGAVASVLAGLNEPPTTLVLASKGLADAPVRLLSAVAKERFGSGRSQVVALSGPNLAVEIARGVPTAAVAASADPAAADETRDAFGCAAFRVYASDDVVGVEVAGALKNVVALGAGIAEGLGFGDNTKGALVARGLKETIALGLAMGGRLETFLGIAGVGDLFATAASPLSRNNRVGRALGRGMSLAAALAEVGQTAEGVPTAAAAGELCRRHGIEAPVLGMIEAIVAGRMRAAEGVSRLMERGTRDEGLAALLGDPPKPSVAD